MRRRKKRANTHTHTEQINNKSEFRIRSNFGASWISMDTVSICLIALILLWLFLRSISIATHSLCVRCNLFGIVLLLFDSSFASCILFYPFLFSLFAFIFCAFVFATLLDESTIVQINGNKKNRTQIQYTNTNEHYNLCIGVQFAIHSMRDRFIHSRIKFKWIQLNIAYTQQLNSIILLFFVFLSLSLSYSSINCFLSFLYMLLFIQFRLASFWSIAVFDFCILTRMRYGGGVGGGVAHISVLYVAMPNIDWIYDGIMLSIWAAKKHLQLHAYIVSL